MKRIGGSGTCDNRVCRTHGEVLVGSFDIVGGRVLSVVLDSIGFLAVIFNIVLAEQGLRKGKLLHFSPGFELLEASLEGDQVWGVACRIVKPEKRLFGVRTDATGGLVLEPGGLIEGCIERKCYFQSFPSSSLSSCLVRTM